MHIYWLSGAPNYKGTPESINLRKFMFYLEEDELIKALLQVTHWSWSMYCFGHL